MKPLRNEVLSVAAARAGLTALVAAAFALCASPAPGITVDGFVSPADEWTSETLTNISDPAPEAPIPPAYDVTDIFLAGGTRLHFRMDVLTPPVVIGRGVYMRFDFALDEDPGAGYSISLNDGLGFDPTEMHLVRFPDWNNRDPSAMQDLGTGTYQIGDVLEASFSWGLFPADVLANDEITLNRYWYLLESGRTTADDGGEGVLTGPPAPQLPVVPEPVTLIGFLFGCGVLAKRLARRRSLEG